MIRGILATMSVLALSACATTPRPVAADATDADAADGAQVYACAAGSPYRDRRTG